MADEMQDTRTNGHTPDALAPSEASAIAVQAHAQTKWGGLNAIATGLAGAFLLSAVGLALLLLLASPMTNAAHFMITTFVAVSCGVCGGMAMAYGRIRDLTQTVEYHRGELTRVTAAKEKVEQQFMRARLSSQGKDKTKS